MGDHVSDLFLHGDGEQGNEVQQQNRPEDWNIQNTEKGAKDCNQQSFRHRQPSKKNKSKFG